MEESILTPQTPRFGIVNKDINKNINFSEQLKIKSNHIPNLIEKSKSKKKEIALARQIAMYIARNMLEMSLPKIGEEFGGRDHSTVMHSISKIEEEKKFDQNIQNVIEEVTSAVIN